jgi:5-methyltetrahydrofolate--homocysteine methyltransferase
MKWRTSPARWSAVALSIPLLIGGATTSAAHTAIKIAPHYSGPIVHVLDASRSVPVTTSLISEDQREGFVRKTKPAPASARGIWQKERSPIAQPSPKLAREKASVLRLEPLRRSPSRSFLGTQVYDSTVKTLA